MRRISRQRLRGKETEPVFTFKREKYIYKVYKFGKLVDEFVGKEGLKKYGLKDHTGFSFDQNGTWYTVYADGEEIDKFQGKSKLARYGLKDDN